MNRTCASTLLTLLAALGPALPQQAGTLGYYRSPTLRGETIVFTSEGDLWTVSIHGGLVRPLTTHLGELSPLAQPAAGVLF